MVHVLIFKQDMIQVFMCHLTSFYFNPFLVILHCSICDLSF